LAKTDARGIHAHITDRAERQQLEAAFDYVREGDSFTVTKLDRLARSEAIC
jgi:DNA invertase Pin-like site-specific DNA recombinase